MHVNYRRTLAVLVLLVSGVLHAQDRPFLFTFTPASAERAGLFLQYAGAYGKQTFEPLSGDAMEQSIGVQANLSAEWTILGHLGIALHDATSRSSQHVELLGRVLHAEDHLVDLRAGVGVRHEYSGTNVLLVRGSVGRRFTSFMTYGNILLERPFAGDRDGVDIMMTLGISYDLSRMARVGIEAVGQDLEGFWDDEEAEGGARLFIGPTTSLAIEGSPWNITVGGGVILRGSTSNRSSSALRDLPGTAGNGFLVRTMIGYAL